MKFSTKSPWKYALEKDTKSTTLNETWGAGVETQKKPLEIRPRKGHEVYNPNPTPELRTLNNMKWVRHFKLL